MSRANLLAALAPLLQETDRTTALNEALQAAREISALEGGARAKVLTALAPYLSGVLLDDAIKIARAEVDTRFRTRALASLMPYLPEVDRAAVLDKELQSVKSIHHPGTFADALTTLAPYLSDTDQGIVPNFALQATAAIKNVQSRIQTLVALAPHLPKAGYAVALDGVLHATLVIEEPLLRANAMSALATLFCDENPATAWNLLLESVTIQGGRRACLYALHDKALSAAMRLEGIAGLRELRRAVSETGRWFP